MKNDDCKLKITEPADTEAGEMSRLERDHRALADTVHGMLGRLLVLEARVDLIEKRYRNDLRQTHERCTA